MSLKHDEVVIEVENPFVNCKLNRKEYANALTSIIESYPSGFVLAINNRWGTGKTTFIKMWKQDLENNSFKTLYFNAWENDFENNPLTALMGELKTLIGSNSSPEFKKVLKYGATLSKHVIPLLIQALADKYINTKLVKDTLEGISKDAADIFEEEVNEYANKKEGIQEFRKTLSEFVNTISSKKPLVFFIDELDRCRPNYAVSILEQIKHFFSVSNIVFVLSIDKGQLGNAVRGVYGSEKIDSDEYLRRFIDIEYSIPEPDKDDFYKYLYDYFKFDEFFNSKIRQEAYEFIDDKEEFLGIAKLLFQNSQIPLRQQEKIFSHARLSLRTFKNRSYVIPVLFLFLVYVKNVEYEFYIQLINKSLNLRELQEKFYEIVRKSLSKHNERSLMWIEAYLILFYNNYKEVNGTENKVYEISNSGAITLKIKSIINDQNDSLFSEIFDGINRKTKSNHLSINYVLNKINLTEEIIS